MERVRMVHWLLLAAILCAGGVLRFAYLEGTLVQYPAGSGDAAYYVRYAHNLLDYATFSRDDRVDGAPTPDAYWAPGYPVFLAAIIAFSNALQIDAYHAVLVAQMTLGTLSIGLVFLLAAHCMPVAWALLPAALVAGSPHLVATAQYLISETLTGFLLLASLLLLLRGLARPARGPLAAAGTGFALCYLTNPVTLFAAPLTVGLAWLLGGQEPGAPPRAAAKRALVLTLAPLLVAAALWAARGAISVPPGSTGSGDRLLTNLVQGMHEDFHEVWRADPRNPDNPATLDLARVDSSYAAFFRIWRAKFTEEPGAMLTWYLVKKPVLFWDWDIRVGAGDIYTYSIIYSLYQTSSPALASYSLMRSLHPWLVACAVLSLIYLTRYREPGSWAPALLYLCVAYVTAVYVIAQAEPRYSFPLRPEMYTLAAYFLWRLTRTLQRYRSRPAPAASEVAPAVSRI